MNSNLKPPWRLFRGWSALVTCPGNSSNLRFKRFLRGLMGSDMVVQKRVSMLCRRQSSKWVTDCFTQSADVPDGPHTAFREVKDLGVKSASGRQKGRRSAQKCDRQAK